MNHSLSRGRFMGLVAAGSGLSGLAATASTVAAETYTLRLSTSEPAISIEARTAGRFADAVARRTNGQVKIEVYPNLILVKEGTTIDGLVSGVIDFSALTSAILVPLFPRFQIFDTPFLFKDLTAAYKILDGPIGNSLLAELETKGIVGLGWGTGGFKQISTTNRSIVTPEDMKGLRIRVQPGALYVATYQSLGAIPVVIDMSEAVVALTQHTVDAIDINLDSVTKRFGTVIKHIAMANQMMSVLPLMASKRKMDALPAPIQKIIREEGRAVVPSWRTEIARQVAEDVEILKKNGVVFTQIDYPAFRKAVEPVYALVESKIGSDLIDRVGKGA